MKTLCKIADYFDMDLVDFIADRGFYENELPAWKVWAMKKEALEKSTVVPGKVKITAKEIGNTAAITIGGVMIPVTKATIHIEVGKYVKVELETRADLVDVEALQKDTELIIKETP